MSKLTNKLSTISKNLICCRSGFALVELMIVVVLLVVVLTTGFMFYFFGLTSFDTGRTQTDVQQNARLVANFISEELRVAERVIILDHYEGDLTELDLDALETLLDIEIDDPEEDNFEVFFIFERDESIYYQAVDGTDQPAVYLEGISQDIDFDIIFEKGAKNNILNINIFTTDTGSGRKYHMETEVLALNLDVIEDELAYYDDETYEDGTGTAIIYQVPAPNPEIRDTNLSPRYPTYGVEDEKEIGVEVFTREVSDGRKVEAVLWQSKPEGEPENKGIVSLSGLEIQNNEAQFSFELDSEWYFGDYYVEIDLVDIVVSSRRELFSILPVVEFKDTTKDVLGKPHVDIGIKTHGVQDGTNVELVQEDYPEANEAFEGNELFIALIERPGEDYEYLEISHQSGADTVEEDGVEFTARIDSDFDSRDNLFLRAKIGRIDWVERELLTIVTGLSNLAVNEGELDPDFDSEEANYSVEVGSEIGEIGVTATLEDTEDEITIDGEPASSGEPKIVSLNDPGETTMIDIVVTREDEGTTMEYVYTIEVTEDH